MSLQWFYPGFSFSVVINNKSIIINKYIIEDLNIIWYDMIYDVMWYNIIYTIMSFLATLLLSEVLWHGGRPIKLFLKLLVFITGLSRLAAELKLITEQLEDCEPLRSCSQSMLIYLWSPISCHCLHLINNAARKWVFLSHHCHPVILQP